MEIEITNKEKIVILKAVKSGVVNNEFLEYCKSVVSKDLQRMTDKELIDKINELKRKLE